MPFTRSGWTSVPPISISRICVTYVLYSEGGRGADWQSLNQRWPRRIPLRTGAGGVRRHTVLDPPIRGTMFRLSRLKADYDFMLIKTYQYRWWLGVSDYTTYRIHICILYIIWLGAVGPTTTTTTGRTDARNARK